MRFQVPGDNLAFEIPDEWWEAGGMRGNPSPALHYRPARSSGCLVAPIEEVRPPLRTVENLWFRNRDTVVDLLRAIQEGTPLPPIEVWSKGKKDPTRYKVRDGFHRFYLSVAVGFTHIPIAVQDFDLDEFLAHEARRC